MMLAGTLADMVNVLARRAGFEDYEVSRRPDYPAYDVALYDAVVDEWVNFEVSEKTVALYSGDRTFAEADLTRAVARAKGRLVESVAVPLDEEEYQTLAEADARRWRGSGYGDSSYAVIYGRNPRPASLGRPVFLR